MVGDRASSERGWLALSCRRDGEIVHVLHDDLGVARDAALFNDIVDSGSSQKAAQLLDALNELHHIIGWELNVRSGDAARALYFAGAAADDSLLVLGAPGPSAIAELFDFVAGTNLSLSHALRNLLSNERAGITAAMTRDRQLYDELSRLNNELINRERELARKSAALERLSAEKSRIVAIAAHDLRNPLTVIASYADLLRIEDAVRGDHLLYVDEISRSARFMMELVEELLDSSRLESGHIEVRLEDVDLVHAAQHAATINRMRADRKRILLRFEPLVEQAMLRADPVKLRQIINNLVVNAIKFSPSGANVTIRVRRAESSALLEVEDQGVGIPKDKLDVIFEPFRTLGASGTAGEASTGLGLAIVKQLAELHGARVSIESEIGRGSLFRVAFPVTE